MVLMSDDVNTFNWIDSSTKKLEEAGIATPRLDCLILLEDELNTNRAQLLAYPETILTSVQNDNLAQKLTRRAQHEPLAYIRGKTEFYGRDFIVNRHVLEPRPESETMINLLKQLSFKQRISIADIGSGSGALGITAALELHYKIDLFLHDIDKNTLLVAKQNADLHNVQATCIQTDLVNNNNADLDILLCNLPYVPTDFQINTAATHEPKIAIFGGHDGLDLYRSLFNQMDKRSQKPSFVLTESLPFQHSDLAAIALNSGYKLMMSEDFIQVFSANR
jgi:release factor glutamine methyltransferase